LSKYQSGLLHLTNSRFLYDMGAAMVWALGVKAFA